MAPQVAEILAKVLEKDDKWVAQQVKEYQALADEYILK